MASILKRDATVLGACPQDCPDTCAFIYTVKKGRLVDVRGNPEHPFTRGGLCVKLKDFARHHYHTDRVLYPLKRVGAKGEGRFERVSWDEALAEIRTRWAAIIEEYGPSAILPHNYMGTEGILNGLTCGDAFFNKLGASIAEKTYCGSAAATASLMTCGPCAGVDPESFVASKFIILWACNTVSTNLHHWPFILQARHAGAEVVVIDPVKTRTAKQATWHIACRPGTDAALALAMIHVIIEDGLVDNEYVDNYTIGFKELRERATRYTPDKVERITGVAAGDIRKLARDFATKQPSVIRVGVALERHRGGGQAVRAVCCLPALAGSWRYPGGGLLIVPIWNFPLRWDRMNRGDLIRPGTRVLNVLKTGEYLTSDCLDPPVKSFFCYNSNPVVQAPEQNRIIRGLLREDLFTVVSELFITDTARYADIVLPATMQAEQFDVMFSWGHNYLTLNQRAIDAPGEAVPNVELFRRLAAAMGMTGAEWRRLDEEMIRDYIDWDHAHMQGITLDVLKEKGYARLNVGDPVTRAPHAKGNFPTRSGKVELKSESLESFGNMVADILRSGSTEFQPRNRIDPLPEYIPPYESVSSNAELGSRFPLSLLSPKAHGFLNSQYANEIRHARRQGRQFVMMSPGDAAPRNIHSGARVRVYNTRGEFLARAEVTEDVMRGVVVTPLGYWMSLSDGGSTVNSVNHAKFVEMGNAPAFSDNLVQVEIAN